MPTPHEEVGAGFEGREMLQDFKDWKGVARAFVDTKREVGRRAVKVPDANAPPAEKAEFYKKLGAASDPKEYGDAPEGLRSAALAALLSPAQFKAMSDAFSAEATTKEQAAGKARETAAKTLREKLGAKYEETKTLAERGAASLFPEAVRKQLMDQGVLLDESVLTNLATLQRSLEGNPSIQFGSSTPPPGKRSAAQAAVRAKEIFRNKEFTDKTAPSYPKLHKEYDDCMKIIAEAGFDSVMTVPGQESV